MTDQAQENQDQPSDKELNFRKQEAMYQRILQEKDARIAALTQESQQLQKSTPVHYEEEEEDDEPYVAPKKLKKQLAKHGQTTDAQIAKAMESAKQSAKEELRQELWLENHPDFFAVIEGSDKLAEKNPRLADTILKMPKSFETQKLVYHTMKELGLDSEGQKKQKQTMQDTINKNQQSPYYMPSGVGSSPYQVSGGDFSDQGQKAAYEKMQQLKSSLGIG